MLEIVLALGAFFLAFCGVTYIHIRINRKTIEAIKAQGQAEVTLPPAPQVNVNLKPLQDEIEKLPGKVLQSITGCANTHKGALGELIGYINMKAEYDKIIPLGNIVDFMCIRFPNGSRAGTVDFVDVKTGPHSRLSKEQKMLQTMISEKQINFVKLRVDTQQHEGTTKRD